jgi:hypothetical protein
MVVSPFSIYQLLFFVVSLDQLNQSTASMPDKIEFVVSETTTINAQPTRQFRDIIMQRYAILWFVKQLIPFPSQPEELTETHSNHAQGVSESHGVRAITREAVFR